MNTMNRILSVYKTINGLSNYENSLPKSVQEKDDFYSGLDNEPTPLKIFQPNHSNGSILILYPGASAKGETHPKLITLARSFAVNGVKVFLPRIPHLIDLKLSEDILLWTVHFYKWVFKNFSKHNNQINLAGISFGGVIVLKSCLNPFLIKNKPKSILVFGTSYDAKTSMQFMYNGKINYNDEEIKIKPDPWSVIVILHNYLSKINTGYSTKMIERALRYLIYEKFEKFEEAINKLNDFERSLINDTMELNISHELKRIMDMIFNDCSDEIDFFSARKWCENITNNVFIIHGRNDSLSPFTESIKLDNRLQNSNLLISGLFEHREISNRISFISKLKETFKIVNFLSRYYKEAFSI